MGGLHLLNQLKRRSWVFLKPTDFLVPLLGVDVFPMGPTALTLHSVLLRQSKVYQHMVIPPILDNKQTSMPSAFAPAALLREARRQKGLDAVAVPPVCILDPDGDLVLHLRRTGAAKPFAGWPCYHTELDTFDIAGYQVGIVGRVVGASFAVLVAEELFASGCRLLVSLTSAGQITPAGPPPYFVVIDRALRDEGTSYHYAPPSEFAEADPELVKCAAAALAA